MANENETVEQVCEIVHKEINNYIGRLGYGLLVLMKTNDFINRTLAAHKRKLAAKDRIIEAKDAEIADFQRRYDECVRRFNKADLERVRLRDEVAAKDAEIARLVNIINTECNKCGDCAKFGSDCSAGDVDGNENCRACSRFVPNQIATLRALVNELARGFMTIKNAARFKEYGGKGVRFCGSVTTNFWHETADIAKKAREAVSKM